MILIILAYGGGILKGLNALTAMCGQNSNVSVKLQRQNG